MNYPHYLSVFSALSIVHQPERKGVPGVVKEKASKDTGRQEQADVKAQAASQTGSRTHSSTTCV